ncbi:MAG: hypothetical protein IKC73_05495, partial [Clostridia bacterium]|nr:hypothetical protein [Clostridia bacterium]
ALLPCHRATDGENRCKSATPWYHPTPKDWCNSRISIRASSFIPTIPGRLFYLRELAGPLVPDAN